MTGKFRSDANAIISYCISKVMPDRVVRDTLRDFELPSGRLILVSVGKAAWSMANAAVQCLCEQFPKLREEIDSQGDSFTGYVITKYGHCKGDIPGVKCFEAGHPLPDKNGVSATQTIIDAVASLTKDDKVLFLVSGGGSALFEAPVIPLDELSRITGELLARGAGIAEINAVRRQLSLVKGGRFARLCEPAFITQIILSDVIGDDPSVIASGPAYPCSVGEYSALDVIEKYAIKVDTNTINALNRPFVKDLNNVSTTVGGSVRELTRAAAEACEHLGYDTVVLTDRLDCEAYEAGRFLGSMVGYYTEKNKKTAVVAGGETVVHLNRAATISPEGEQKETQMRAMGGRNQVITLSAAPYLSGKNACVFSFGSDGTDGPTDAAGGFTDGNTLSEALEAGIDIEKYLRADDSYHALKALSGLIITGPTGTNVNDVSICLIDRTCAVVPDYPMSFSELIKNIDMCREIAGKLEELHYSCDIAKYEEQICALMHRTHPFEAVLALETAFPSDKTGIHTLMFELEAALRMAEAYKNKGIPAEIYYDTFKCFSRFVNEYTRMNGECGFDVAHWAYRQVNMSIFRLGALEYEFIATDGVDAEKHIEIHIPSDADFRIESVKASLAKLEEFIGTFYPMFTGVDLLCDSWLLAPALDGLLPESSNIREFRKLFDVVEVDEEDDNFFRFLYGVKDDVPIAELPERTSLQRKAKQHLLDYGKIGSARGIIIKELKK